MSNDPTTVIGLAVIGVLVLAWMVWAQWHDGGDA